MRRALALIACLSLLGCDQPADLVGYTIAPLDTGGAGGMGSAGAGSSATGGGSAGSGSTSASTGGSASGGMSGVGGMGQTGGSEAEDDPTCDSAAAIGLALVRLTPRVNNGCIFDTRTAEDIALGTLVWQYVDTLSPVSDPETVPFDFECSTSNSRGRWVNDGGQWMLCPAYCEALKRRLLELEAALEQCAGI